MTTRASADRKEIGADEAIKAVLARYGDIAGDSAAFGEALSQPLLPCVWANPLRLTRQRLATLLAEDGISSEPVAWSANALRLDLKCRPGLSWPYRAGLMQIQEESAMLSVRLLDPQPGDRVLDLCAAPGNKTAQIAVALGNRGTVVANDRNVGRLAPLHAAISRMGLTNVTTTAHTGVSYPAQNASFDKVLVDVPCSGEGTVRKGTGKHKPVSASFRHWLTGIQTGLLNRAIDLCRPGGRIVYSTCTIAPEENEAIVDRLLATRPNDIRVIAASVPGLETSSGVTSWRSRSFSEAASQSIRLWPHITDTSGFFAVLFERGGDKTEIADHGGLPHLPDSPAASLGHFIENFGLPDALLDQCSVIGSRSQRRLVAGDHRPPQAPPAQATGLALTRDKAKQPKLSTQAALALGDRATRNLIELEHSEIQTYMDRGDLSLSPSRVSTCSGPGYVIVRHQGFALGLATLRQHDKSWICESLFPKERG